MNKIIAFTQLSIDDLKDHTGNRLDHGMAFWVVRDGHIHPPRFIDRNTPIVEMYIKCDLGMIWGIKEHAPTSLFTIPLRHAKASDFIITKTLFRDDCIYYLHNDYPMRLRDDTDMKSLASWQRKKMAYVQDGPGQMMITNPAGVPAINKPSMKAQTQQLL
jgi:hypothetical protein